MSEQKPDNLTTNFLPILEALLFIAPGTVTPTQLASALDISVSQVEEGLKELDLIYHDRANQRGIRLQRLHGRYQLTTIPEAASIVEKFLGLDSPTRLSRAALETLAVVAYKEPVTRPQIDSIRGVNSDGVLKNLLNKGLVQEIGRAEAPGRPILYSITSDFLQHFGLNSLAELPPLEMEGEKPMIQDNIEEGADSPPME
jgi:segregation and condensation protein B